MSLFDSVTTAAAPYILLIKASAVVFVVVVVSILWWRGNYFEDKYISEQAQFKNFTHTQEILAKAQLQDQERKDKEASAATAAGKSAHDEEIKKFSINLDKLKKELDHDKIYIANAIAKRERVRGDSASTSTVTPAEIPVPPSLSAESGGDCDATLARTVSRCRDTTINYNSLYNAWVDDCAIYGCQK